MSQQTVSEKVTLISEYFIAQLFLAADLCLDRNYVSIGLLEAHYPYPVLLAILKMPGMSTLVKAPVCRLIRCLYVDREPQIEVKYPRLVKTVLTRSSIRDDMVSDEGKDCHDKGSASTSPPSCTFGVLQVIISEYLHNKLDASKCDELSSEMLDTLLILMKFGYYNSTAQLQDIIVPLVHALDDHYMNRSRDVNSTTTKKKSSIILLQEKVGRKTVFGSSAPAARIDETDIADQVDARASNKVNVNFRHTRRTLNEAMYSSLSNQNKNNSKDDDSRRSILASTSVEKKSYVDMDISNVPMELKILRVLESLPGLVIILLIVIIATIFATVQLLLGQEENQSTYIFELSISVLFILELSIRSYCYFLVHKELNSFISQPLNVLDILLVVFDICLISLDSTILGGAKSYAKTLK